MVDPIDPAERRRLEAAFEEEVIALYWAMRKAVRRFRVAKGKGGPRRRYKGGKARRRFRRFPGRNGGKGRKGFFVGDSFVSLDDVPEADLEVFFKGRKGGKSKVKCYRCGKPGHMAKDFSSPEVCFKCGQIGHRQFECPQGRIAFADAASGETFCPSFVGHYPVTLVQGPDEETY